MDQPDIEMIDPDGPLRLPMARMPPEGHATKALYRFRGQDRVHELLLVRLLGRLFALNSLCPHAGGRFAEGPLIDGENVHCPLHLYKFRPSDGHAVDTACSPASIFTLHEEDGAVRIDVGSSSEQDAE